MDLRISHYIVLIAALLIWSMDGLCSDSNAKSEIAPNWMMPTISGQQASLYGELEQGNSVIMVFWATWCKFCRDLLPALDDYNKTIQKKPIRVFALNIWEDGDPETYLKENNITLEAILNADSQAKQFSIKGTPAVIVVAPNKQIIYRRKSGESTQEVMESLRKL